MKRIILFTGVFFLLSINILFAQCCKEGASANCSKTNTTQSKSVGNSPVSVYYFHATRRCVTCMAVEDVAKDAIKKLYNGKVAFTSINSEEDAKNPLIEKYKVSGQTLLIIKGDKVIDLTNEAFLNARTNPDKYKSKLKEVIDRM